MLRTGVLFLLVGWFALGQPVSGEPPAASTLGISPSDRPVTDTAPRETLDLSDHTVVFSVDDGYHSVFTNMYPLLKKHGMTMSLGVICDYVRSGKPSYNPSAGFMKKSEIQELIDSLDIEIASHSLSHPFLTRLDSSEAWKEIHNSKAILESLFDVDVATFVYPYGDMNARVRSMVKKAGYKMGRAVRPGTPNFWADPYRLPIIELRMETKLEDMKRSIANRNTTIVLAHQVVEKPKVFTEWNLADFTALVEWMAATRVRVTTLDALYHEWWYKRMGLFMEEVAAAYPDSRKKLLFQDVDIDATQAFQPR